MIAPSRVAVIGLQLLQLQNRVVLVLCQGPTVQTTTKLKIHKLG